VLHQDQHIGFCLAVITNNKEEEIMRKQMKRTKMTEGDQPSVIQHLLTVDDACSILGLSRVKVYDLIKRDGLPTVKINGARRIQPSKLLAWIEQHSV
jgi:excisionase family DNA binding protein